MRNNHYVYTAQNPNVYRDRCGFSDDVYDLVYKLLVLSTSDALSTTLL